MAEIMFRIYCNDNHKTHITLCSECNELLEYVKERLDRCPFKERKTGCGRCGLPCYEPKKKEKVIAVFTYSGPQMFIHHPVLAFHHVLDSLRGPKKSGS